MPRRPPVPIALLACAVAGGLAGCGAEAQRAASLTPGQDVPATKQASLRAQPLRGAVIVPHGWRLLVELRGTAALRARPGGRIVARLGPTTSFHSPVVLPVMRRRGGWYAVLSSALPDGRVGWIAASAPLRRYTTDYRIDVSLRQRRVVVRHGRQVVARLPVAVGAPGTPTPTGRFAVTDKLVTKGSGSPYGCCILALSGHQAHTPQGWGGGDRIAIHATDKPSTIGQAASLGCLRAPEPVMRRLVGLVPLGTVVTIRA